MACSDEDKGYFNGSIKTTYTLKGQRDGRAGNKAQRASRRHCDHGHRQCTQRAQAAIDRPAKIEGVRVSFTPASDRTYGANRWFASRYNVNNARNFNGNNGNLNNNNVNNANHVSAVTNLSKKVLPSAYHGGTVGSLLFTKNMYSPSWAASRDNYYSTRKNKRYGRDQMSYEMNWPVYVVQGMRDRANRTFRVRNNYAFLVSRPRWREIFATEFEGRRADHEICDVLMPLAEKVLSPRTYNNRKGMGAMGAMNQVIEDMAEVSNGYTSPAWIIKLDMKGYFPNAEWDYAEQCLQRLLDDYDGEDKDYLRWLTMILIHANPAAHCELRTPRHFWHENIAPEKSLLAKPEGVGAAIGRLIWQTAMGLYINDEIKWLNEECGLHVVCFVDDIVIQVPESRKGYALSLLPELRRRLMAKGVRMNEKKFYCQPYTHGLEFLGSHIKPKRIHLNDKTYHAAIERIEEFNRLSAVDKYRNIDKFIATVNSYTGALKGRTSLRRIRQIHDKIDKTWWKWLQWDDARKCVVSKPEYTMCARLREKYHLKRKENDTRRKAHAHQ